MSLDAAIVAFLIARKRILFAVFLIVISALAWAIPSLQVSTSNRAFFGADNPEYIDVRRIDDTFTSAGSLLFMMVPPEGQAFSPQTLATMRILTDNAWQIPYVLRVDSPINTMHSYAVGDEIFVEPMLEDSDQITPEAAARFRDLALASEDLVNRLVAQNGDAYGLAVRVILPSDVPGVHRDLEAHILELQDGWQSAYPDWNFHVTGGLLMSNLLGRVAIQDILYVVPIALIVAIGLLTVFLGSISMVAASLCVLVTATLATLGFASWTGVVLTAGTAISPLAVLVLVSTSCVHINLGWIRATEDPEIEDPFRHSLTNNVWPVTVSHLTTALGFLCLNFAPSPPLQQMGNIVAFGLLFALVGVFILLPFILSHRRADARRKPLISAEAMRALSRWIIHRRLIWLTGFPILFALAVIGILRIEFDDNIFRYFDDRYEFRRDAEAIQDRLTGLESLQFAFRAPEGTTVFDPEFLRRVDRFVDWLEVQPEIDAVGSITHTLKSLNQSMFDEDPAAYVIADSQEANAQLMMLYEMSLPMGMDLGGVLDVDRTQTLVSATIRSRHSSETRALAVAADAWLDENEPSLTDRASGLALAFARLSERNNRQMLLGLLAVLVLVSITMMVTLRSLKFGALSLVPNIVPAFLGFGLWGFTVGDVNLGSTVVTTMTFGIVVDDTVHFLMHYLRCRRRNLGPMEAIENTFSVVGSSIILTSITLIAGFGVMAASGFAVNQHLGLLTAVVICFALLCDLLLLPSLILSVEREKS